MPRNRKIPATMATQHPDNAHTPYWHYSPFISTKDEIRELYLSFKDLGITEYKWDWEGKLVDESVLERILAEYFDYFQKNVIGKDKFITFRLPNPKVQTEYRLGRSFMGIIAASGLSRIAGFEVDPLFEVVIPMTTTAREMFDTQEAFKEIANVNHPLLKRGEGEIDNIEIIPLFEDIDTISNSDKILEEYVQMHMKGFGFKPDYIRPYMARSDPALNAGIVPTVLAIKIALSKYKDFSLRRGIPLHPMIGAACLPFRGGISPVTIDDFMNEYAGIRTTTIQSAFRYDYPKEDVIEALEKLETNLVKKEARSISVPEEKKLREMMKIFTKYYQKSIIQIAPYINQTAAFIPKRRERVQHIGLFGYSRGVGEVKLPRAITFTAAMYSLGVPPEIIGTGNGLKDKNMQDLLSLLESNFINIRSNLTYSLKYTNFSILRSLSKENEGFRDILDSAEYIKEYLGSDVKKSPEEKEHEGLTSKIFNKLKNKQSPGKLIEKAALLRKSIG